ncbi:MAG: hypothetical protein H6714_01700 [Myxococcales bacterium]|nr:hypothetical protein [Myxococcales bacterium]
MMKTFSLYGLALGLSMMITSSLALAQASETPEAPLSAPPAASPAPNADTKTTLELRSPPPEPPPPPPPPRQYVHTYDAENPPAQSYGYAPEDDRFGQISAYLGMPIWLSSAGDVLTTGFSFEGRFGFDLGYVVPELGFGTQVNWFDDNAVTRNNDSLSAFWLTMGVRFQWLNPSFFTPFISGAVDMNWWHTTGDSTTVCDFYYCTVEDNRRFAPGFSGRLGVALQVHPRFALEMGLRLAMTFEGSMFSHPESWLSPFFGGSFYF